MEDYNHPDVKTIMDKAKSTFSTISSNACDKAIALLANKLDMGATLQALWIILVQTKIFESIKALCLEMLVDYDSALELRAAYLLVKDYNMISYSGCCYSRLARYSKKLRNYLEQYPNEAIFLGGEAHEKTFIFAEQSYPYSIENRETQEKAIEKSKQDEIDKADLGAMKIDD